MSFGGFIRGFAGDLFWSSIEKAGNMEENSFSTVKFVAITGSISLVLFGIGYMFYGLGTTLAPVSVIIDELHDSDTENDTENDSKNRINIKTTDDNIYFS